MSGRLFSILRRKPGFVHFVTPILDSVSTGVAKYRLYTDSSPDFPSPTAVVTVTSNGLVDPAVAGQTPIIPGNNVSIIMKPSNYGLPDSAFFWLKLVYVDSGGSDMTSPAPSAPTLVLPPFVGNEQSGFNATAPSESTIADSLRIDLPRQMSNFRIRNLSTTIDLYVAFQDGGPEIVVPGQASSQESVGFDGLVSSIWVRGSSGSPAFSTQFTYANPR
jgi:hypothetical protein